MCFNTFSRHSAGFRFGKTFAVVLVVQSLCALAPESRVGWVFRTRGWNDESFPVPIHFPRSNRDLSSRWLEIRLVVRALNRVLMRKDGPDVGVELGEIVEQAKSFESWGRPPFKNDTQAGTWVHERLLTLIQIGVLRQDPESSAYRIARSPRMLAYLGEDIEWIQNDLSSALRDSDREFYERLTHYAVLTMTGQQLFNPTEARYPMLKALSYMTSEELGVILDRIRSLHPDVPVAPGSVRETYRPLYEAPLVNTILLTFGDSRDRENWSRMHAPNLEDTVIYDLTPEYSSLSGGLGRVQQYHTRAMSELLDDSVRLVVGEAYYHWMKDPRGTAFVETDLGRAAVPVTVTAEDEPFEMEFLPGEKHRIQVVHGVNSQGIPVSLLRDVPLKGADSHPRGYPMVGKLYVYNEPGAPSELEFAGFFAKAHWENIKRKERKRKRELESAGKTWKPPVINTNDAQTNLLPVYRLVDYHGALSNAARAAASDDGRFNGAAEAEWLAEARFLESFFINATTHTYRNRGFFEYNDYTRRVLGEIGIPYEFHWLFLSSADPGEITGGGLVDLSKAGLAAANCRKAVSALHAHEVGLHDPGKKLYGVTNGDNREISTKYLRAYLHPEFAGRFMEFSGNPTMETLTRIVERVNAREDAVTIRDLDRIAEEDPARIARAKALARKVLKNLHDRDLPRGAQLDPEAVIIDYSGRLVEEKRCSRVFDLRHEINETGEHLYYGDSPNIEALVKAGANVVIYGNVQIKDHNSVKIGKAFKDLEQKILAMKIKDPAIRGNFVFKDSFTYEEQLMLLAATDVQIQDSDRATGAAEYTESDATANGAWSMGSPYPEGVIQEHAVPTNFDKPGFGNGLIPVDTRPESYRAQLLKVMALGREKMAPYQANSILESRILAHINTGADYLRMYDYEYGEHLERLEQGRTTLPMPWHEFENRESWPLLRAVDVMKHVPDPETGMENSMIEWHKLERNLTFERGSRIDLQVKVDLKKRPVGEVEVMVRTPDRNLVPLTLDRQMKQNKNAHETPIGLYFFRLPTDQTGEFEIVLTDGLQRESWPYKVETAMRMPRNIEARRSRGIDGSRELDFRIGDYYLGKNKGGLFHLGLKHRNYFAWEYRVTPGEVDVVLRENGERVVRDLAEFALENDPGTYDIPLRRLANRTADLKLVFHNPDLYAIHFVLVDLDTGRHHDRSGMNYSFRIDSQVDSDYPVGLNSWRSGGPGWGALRELVDRAA